MVSHLKRLGKDSLVYGLGGAAAKFLGFLLLPIYTRVFSPSDYGVVDVIATMTALAGIVLTAGTETALNYYFHREPAPEERRRTVSSSAAYLVSVNALVAVCVWLLAEAITSEVLQDPAASSYLRIAVAALPFSSLYALQLNILRLNRRPWSYIALSVPHTVAVLGLNIILVVSVEMGIRGVFYGNLIAAVIFATVGTFVNRRYMTRAPDLQRLYQLVKYGFPLVIGGVSMWSINYLDRYFLIRYSGLNEVGLYAVGSKIGSAVALLTMAFRTANAPFQFEIAADPKAKNIYSRTLSYYVLVVSFVSVTVAVFSRPLLAVMAVPEYAEAYKVVALAAFSIGAYGAYQLVSVGLLVTERTGFTGIAIGAGAILNIVYLFLFVPPLGFVGAGLATLATHLSVIGLLVWGAQAGYPIAFELGRVMRIVTVAAAIAIVDVYRPSFGVLQDLVVGSFLVCAFVAAIPLLSLLRREDTVTLIHHTRAFFARA